MGNKDSSLGDLIRDARVDAGLSLRELARRIEMAPSYVSDIENDRRVPSEPVLQRIAQELDLNFEELVALGGRIGAKAERLVRRSPEAVRLFRTASGLGEEELRKLRKRAEQMVKKKDAD